MDRINYMFGSSTTWARSTSHPMTMVMKNTQTDNSIWKRHGHSIQLQESIFHLHNTTMIYHIYDQYFLRLIWGTLRSMRERERQREINRQTVRDSLYKHILFHLHEKGLGRAQMLYWRPLPYNIYNCTNIDNSCAYGLTTTKIASVHTTPKYCW